MPEPRFLQIRLEQQDVKKIPKKNIYADLILELINNIILDLQIGTYGLHLKKQYIEIHLNTIASNNRILKSDVQICRFSTKCWLII